MGSEFSFTEWCEANGLTSKTSSTLKEEDLDVLDALVLLTKEDIAEMGLTRGQAKLVLKAVTTLRAPKASVSQTIQDPLTTTSLAKEKTVDDNQSVIKVPEKVTRQQLLAVCWQVRVMSLLLSSLPS